jgi:hypothetical protein
MKKQVHLLFGETLAIKALWPHHGLPVAVGSVE